MILYFLSAPDTTPLRTTATKSSSSSTVKVTWERATEEQLSGDLHGVYIKYQVVSRGGEPILDLHAEPSETVIVCADANEIILNSLTPYTTYKIEVAVLRTGEIGNLSEPVYGGIA